MRKLSTLTIVVCMCALTGCSKDPSEVTITLKDIGDVSIHTEKQAGFLSDNDFSNNLIQYANATQRCDGPLPVPLSWDISHKSKSYTIYVSEKEDMSNPWTFTCSDTSFDLYNSKINTTYYWKITANYKSVSFDSDISSFKVTDTSMRNIYVDGVDNIRDLGGYITSNNKTIKQGMIYRTARFNDSDGNINITEKGLKTIKEQLKIKSDIDVRKNLECGSDEIGGITSSPLGEDVNYYNYPMFFEGKNIFEFSGDETKKAINDASIKSFFNALAKEDNYPIMFHCTHGKDRTGALAYALEALLGVSENDMIHDYLFTNFARLGSAAVSASDVTGNARIGGRINIQEGETLQEKAFTYLTNLGIEEATLNTIVDLLTE